MDPTNLPTRTTPHWDMYRRDMFMLAAEQKHPLFSTDPEELEELAKKTLSQGGWLYASCNAGNSLTHRANREDTILIPLAFYRQRIVPRMLVDTNARDTTTELFGHKISAPICFAPVGINKIYHPLGELNAAKVAGELGLPYCLSTAASQSIEDVAAANGQNAMRFFQLYSPPDEELMESILRRAIDNGFTACIWTVDTWQLGWRHGDVANSNYAFYKGIGAELGWSDPVFQKRMQERGLSKEKNPVETGQLWIDQVWHGKAFSWDDLPRVMKKWKDMSGGKPFLVKGIQSAEDAKKAVELGVDGIVCSNHAGRQVDGAVGSLDVLPDIVDAVGDKTTVLFDSGIRGGADVFKALALGAKAVLVGRLWIYGMGIAGEAGVRHVMRSLLADFDILFVPFPLTNTYWFWNN
ncbi:hypothetical protein QFC19_001086 [Naganishia cerealis]|uniref:Uncharacterized protein n=1 Tax=Naganishia cerealis TaxID=610337 RepID=A0ACC2WK65_9TREE|nr:hypothetical protein QFC19_001086 [Naganishia cerealis]